MATLESYNIPHTPINHIPICITMVRHGEPEDGDNDLDRSLTLLGVEQARSIGRRITDGGKIDFVICSYARRTWETASALLTTVHQNPHRTLMEDLYPDDSADLVKVMDENQDCTALSQFFMKMDTRVFREYANRFHMNVARVIQAHYEGTDILDKYTCSKPLHVLVVGHAIYLPAIALQYSATPTHDALCRTTTLQFGECLRLRGTCDHMETIEYLRP